MGKAWYQPRGVAGSVLDLHSSLPTAETCVRSNDAYEWHFASPLSSLTATLYVGCGINRQLYGKGIIAPSTPLFPRFRVSISSPLAHDTPEDQEEEEEATSVMSSPLRDV